MNRPYQDKELSTFVGLSVLVHLGVLAFFTIKTVFFTGEAIKIPSAIQVDMVALPDKKPAPARPTKPKPTPTIPKPKKVKNQNDIKKLKKSQSQAIERIKALNKVQEMQEEIKKAENTEQEQKPQPLVKGNLLSEGNSLRGLEKIEFNEYFQKLKQHLHDNWNLPQWLAEANLKAQVAVRIDERGYVVEKAILTSSGHSVFDSTVLAAIDQASPFPTPPSRLKNILNVRGMTFNFPEQ